MSAPYGQFIRQRRRAMGLSVRGLAARAGISTGMVLHIEMGRKAPGPALRARLDRMLAPGNQRHDDERPAYVIGGALFEGEPVIVLCDGEHRPGLFVNREIADATAAHMRALGLPVCPLPVWPDVAVQLAANGGEHPDGGLYLDNGRDTDAIARRITGWMAKAVTAWTAAGTFLEAAKLS